VLSRFIDILRAKHIVNTDAFCALEAQNHGIYDVLLHLVTKISVFTMFFGPGLAKTLVFTQFSPCCKKNFSMPKAQKHCKLKCFGYALRVRGGGGGVAGGSSNEQQSPE